MRSFLLAVGLLGAVVVAEQPEALTTLGVLKGLTLETISGRKFYGFQGVPYAKPPIGKHRFKRSIPGTPWAGVLNATRLPNMCMQHKFGEYLFKEAPFDVLGSEDCLYLNIYTPKLPSGLSDGKLLDVIFYIHGGSFQYLFGDFWGPEHILDRDVVFVNFNYRLNVLGFLSLEDQTCPGNNGLKDQNLALKWVNKHIAAFGGNPNSITISGLSAGGAAIHYQLLSPLSKGLFQRAISSSGSVLNPWAITRKPREKAQVIADSLGCPTNDSILMLECLRDRPAEDVVLAVKKLHGWNKLPVSAIGPVIEQSSATAFIYQQPIDAIKSKNFNDVPVIFTFTSEEGLDFGLRCIASENLTTNLETEWDKLAKVLYEIYDTADPSNAKGLPQIIRKHYLGDKRVTEAIPGFVRSISERWFVNGIQESAILHAQHQASPVYAHRFSYAGDEGFSPDAFYGPLFSPKGLPYKGGAPHAFDHEFLFKTKFSPPVKTFPRPLMMVKTMIDYYMDFITQTSVPSWETVKSGLPNIKFLDIVDPDPKKNLFKTETPTYLQFWDTLGLRENSDANIRPISGEEALGKPHTVALKGAHSEL